MNIIGRKKEIEELKSLESSNKSELVVLYGRRRVGKTFLVDEFMQTALYQAHVGKLVQTTA